MPTRKLIPRGFNCYWHYWLLPNWSENFESYKSIFNPLFLRSRNLSEKSCSKTFNFSKSKITKLPWHISESWKLNKEVRGRRRLGRDMSLKKDKAILLLFKNSPSLALR